MTTTTDYYNFLNLLTENETFSHELTAQLTACDADPKAFFDQNHEVWFDRRGLGRDSNVLTYYFMLGMLEHHNYAVELDWKADVDSLNEAIHLLSNGKLADLVPDEEEDDADSMYDLLDAAEEYLSAQGYCFLMLPMDGDSYPVALIPESKQNTLDDMMDTLFKDV